MFLKRSQLLKELARASLAEDKVFRYNFTVQGGGETMFPPSSFLERFPA
jgi:hypothetical protein